MAEQIIKYGGVTHELSTKTLENDFLNYARRYIVLIGFSLLEPHYIFSFFVMIYRYRQVKHPQKNNNKIDAESQTDEVREY